MEVSDVAERRDIAGRLPQSKANLWESYSRFVDQYLFLLEFTDEALSRLLLFSPTPSHKRRNSRWREVVWGLLQLHRLTVDIALRHRRCIPSDSNHYGTSVSVQNASVSASAIRIALTALQSMGPILQELGSATATDDTDVTRRQAQVRALLERTRFLLRAYLLTHYWRDYWKELRLRLGLQRKENIVMAPGMLMEGGLFHTFARAPSIPEERARIEKEEYIGRRSGRRVRVRPSDDGLLLPVGVRARQLNPSLAPLVDEVTALDGRWRTARVLVGEILYILRPLFQAESEVTCGETASLVKSWFPALAMDLLSLWSLRTAAVRGNAATQIEWRRRRMRLFLYFLRAPAWERATQPTVDNICKQLERVPVFGRLCSNYIWEWLAYWRLYRAEEG